MNSAHSSSSFRSSCIIAPRHPKSRVPTTALERKSFDFSSIDQHQQVLLPDETNRHCSNKNGKANTNGVINGDRRNSLLQQRSPTKSSKRPNATKKKTLPKSISKSVSIGAESQGINNSLYNSKRYIDMETLSVDDDLFFRHLQALKEENKRALKTLERLYKFGQAEEKNSNKNVTINNNNNNNNKKNDHDNTNGNKINNGKSDEEHTSDSNASRHGHENEHASNSLNHNNRFKETEDENVRKCNSNRVHASGDMPAASINGNYIYGLNGDQLLKPAETENGYSENGYVENSRNGSANLENGYDEIDRRSLNLENEYGENSRRGLNLGNGIPRHFRHGVHSNQVNRDNVADMDRRAMDDREKHDANESSEDELDEQLKVKPPPSHVNILPENERDFRGRQSNYDVIANMWNNFSVNETVPYIRNDAGRRSIRKNQGWSPNVTIQEPFKMTLREEKKKEKKQKKIERIKDELLQKKLQEEAELNKRVVPIPIPPSTFLPMYSEQQQQQQEKKQHMKEISKHILKSTEKPFSFLEREEAKTKLKRSQSMSAKIDNSKTTHQRRGSFKANPYPDKLFDLTWKDKEAEQAEYRKIKIKLRSQELLASSSLPPSMKTRGDLKQYKNNRGNKKGDKSILKKKKKEKPFQPLVHHNIPDFEEMQKKIEMALEARKNQNTPTICEPFDLHTAKIPTRRSKFNEAVEKSKNSNMLPPRPGSSFARSNTIAGRDGFGLRDSRRRPSSSIGLRPRSRSVQSGRVSRSRSCSPVYIITEAARLRQEHIRRSVEKEKQEIIKQNAEKKQRQKEISKLQKVVAHKTAAHDPSRFRERETAEKLASFRRAEKDRCREYKAFLRSVDQKNEQRPLLFERESQTNAKRQAHRRYEEILRRAGIDGKTLEAFIAGDKDILQRQLSQQDASDSDEEDQDIPLKSEMGYEVVLKSNNSSRSYENNSEGEFEADENGDENDDDDDDDNDDDDDEDGDDDAAAAAAEDDNYDGGDDDEYDSDDDQDDDKDGVKSNNDGDVDSDDGSYKP